MDVALQSAHNLLNFFDSRRTGSLGCSDILPFGAVGVVAPIKSAIAITAAERTDTDCAELFPLSRVLLFLQVDVCWYTLSYDTARTDSSWIVPSDRRAI